MIWEPVISLNKIYYLVLISTHIYGAASQQKILSYVNKPATEDLSRTIAYKKYLPKRFKKLSYILTKNGLNSAIAYINTDTDLDSSLFILNAQEPYHIVAYSRHPEYINYTAEKIQKVLVHGNASIALKQIISTAQKQIDYVGYKWQLPDQIYPYNVTFVRTLTVDKKTLIVGATLNVEHIHECFILTTRVNKMLTRINKEGLDHVLAVINNDIDKTGYFFINECEPPYRWIAHGASPQLILKDPKTGFKLLAKECPPQVCAGPATVNELVEIAKRGGGFDAYVFRNSIEEPLALRVVYIMPFNYCGHQYALMGVYIPLQAPTDLKDTLFTIYKKTINLVQDVGLSNASVVLHKERSEEFTPFIRESQPPYRALVSSIPTSDEKPAFELKKMLKNPKDRFDPLKVIKDIAWFTNNFGGFFAFCWKESAKQDIKLLIAYIQHYEHAGKEYFVGVRYAPPIFHASTAPTTVK